MESTSGRCGAGALLDRRAALQRLGAAVLVLTSSGCSRSFFLRAAYPESGRIDDATVTASLAAFADTVVPGVEDPDRVAVLMRDPDLPFGPFSRALAADLAARAAARRAGAGFAGLPATERAAVVADGLNGGGIPSRLYNGAVLFAQAAVYGGLASPDGSCAITGSEGAFRFRGLAAQTYPNPEAFLPPPVSSDGNPW